MSNKVFIKEIFESIQGEGPYIGYNQLFIRFTQCNLNCKYCDTDFSSDLKEYTVEELVGETKKYNNIHSISLTGGEPLLNIDFLKEFLPKTDKKIYLETNGTLFDELKEIIDYVDVVSMDIKLNSTSNNGDLFKIHEKFIQIAKQKELFLKVVFDENITEEEISSTIKLAKENNLEIILQPKMDGDDLNISHQGITNIYNKFVKEHDKTRLIPQVHKFLGVK